MFGKFEKKVGADIMRAIVKYLEGEGRPGGIEVTEITSECLRRSYYNRKFGQVYESDSALRMFIGKAFHEVPIYGQHELKLEWEGITGVIDEYDPQTGVLLEKKTTRGGLPKQPHSHHVRQVEAYAVLLTKNGYPFTDAYIVYFDVGEGSLRVFPVEFTRPIDLIALELEERKRVYEKALREETPPPREPGWICDYCPWVRQCYLEEE